MRYAYGIDLFKAVSPDIVLQNLAVDLKERRLNIQTLEQDLAAFEGMRSSGRANRTFAGSPRGARATATRYSLIGTARLNGFEPYAWLRDTLEKLPSYPVNRVHELLPRAR